MPVAVTLQNGQLAMAGACIKGHIASFRFFTKHACPRIICRHVSRAMLHWNEGGHVLSVGMTWTTSAGGEGRGWGSLLDAAAASAGAVAPSPEKGRAAAEEVRCAAEATRTSSGGSVLAPAPQRHAASFMSFL